SSPRRPAAWAWGCRSAAPSSRRTGAGCQPSRTSRMAPCSTCLSPWGHRDEPRTLRARVFCLRGAGPGAVREGWRRRDDLAARLCAPAIRWPWFVAAAAVGGLASDLFHGHGAWMGAGIWLATTAQALIGAWLLRRLLSQPFTLHRIENAVGLAVVSGAIGAPCGALIAAPVLRVAFRTTFGEAWLTWSVAGLVGILVFTPLALVFQEHDWRASRPTPWRALEATLYVLATAAADVVVFGLLPAHRPMAFAVYPVLLWGVLRFGARGASAGLALLGVIAIAGTLMDRGPYAVPDLPPVGDVHLAQLFLGITTVSFLTLAALIHERDRLAGDVREAYAAVRRREDDLRAVIETMPTSAFTARPNGSIDFVNRHWREYTGLAGGV